MRASSIEAGSISKAIPAARNITTRAELADAKISRSGIDSLPPLQQLVDRCRGFLDRATGNVDYRPMMFGKNPPGFAHLAAHRFDIGIIGGFVVIEHAKPIATEIDQPLRVIGQADDQRLFLRASAPTVAPRPGRKEHSPP